MNYPMIRYILSWVLKVEGALMFLPCLAALIYGEQEGFWYLFWAALCFALGFAGSFRKPENTEIYRIRRFTEEAREPQGKAERRRSGLGGPESVRRCALCADRGDSLFR